jgi:hypothetical protein
VEKIVHNFGLRLYISCKKTAERKQSLNERKFAQSGHPVRVTGSDCFDSPHSKAVVASIFVDYSELEKPLEKISFNTCRWRGASFFEIAGLRPGLEMTMLG